MAQRAGLALEHFALGLAKLRGLKVNDWLTKMSPQELREAIAEAVRALEQENGPFVQAFLKALNEGRVQEVLKGTFFAPFLRESVNCKVGSALRHGGPSCMASGNYVWFLLDKVPSSKVSNSGCSSSIAEEAVESSSSTTAAENGTARNRTSKSSDTARGSTTKGSTAKSSGESTAKSSDWH